MKIPEPVPTKVLIEEDLYALDTLSNLLTYFVEKQPGDPVHYNETTIDAFISIAKTLKERVKDRMIDYDGEKYIIMAKGRRRLTLGLKREPDIYIGAEYGLNFIDACRSYFMIRCNRDYYNQRNNTYCGKVLYGLPVKDTFNYESGIKKTEAGYTGWFRISNQSFSLAEVGTKNDAALSIKVLDKVIKTLLTAKFT